MSDLPPPPDIPGLPSGPPPSDIPGLPSAPPPLEPVGDGTRSTARWATTGAGTTVELAGIWARLAARVVDMVLVVSVTAFGTAALYGALFNDASTTADARVLAALVTVGVGVLYEEVWLIAVKPFP